MKITNFWRKKIRARDSHQRNELEFNVTKRDSHEERTETSMTSV